MYSICLVRTSQWPYKLFCLISYLEMKELRVRMFQTSTSIRQKGRNRAESEARFLAWPPHWDPLLLHSHESKIPLWYTLM